MPIGPSNRTAVMTPTGKRKLEEELRYLKSEKRPDIAGKISAAKELGDLSENAEYAAAKEEQAFTEARIVEIENFLRYAEVASEPATSDAVTIGSTITVVDAQGKKAYQIVGLNEANPAEGRISNESPLGRALLGRRVGEVIVFDTPRGPRELRIETVD